MLTILEEKVLINIVWNEHQPLNGAEPSSFGDLDSIWSDCIDSGPHLVALASIPGVVGSLSKKGFVQSSGETVRVTESGFGAYKGIC